MRVLKALDDVSFEIRQGEFFGIVGRNGSGKSTLLKLLASIYRADAGTIRMAGRLAPFIELGVGFNLDLTARENIVLNGVLMGLTPQQTRSRLEPVIEFAELEEFADLKLKNYSSGMLVRLAFSAMLEADADVLLIDEVLAVGDAAFQQKCADAFHEMKSAGKTIVLVTHEMGTVEAYCHRAMLIDSGKVQHIGDPGDIGREYLQLNFERGSPDDHATTMGGSEEVRLLDCWIEDEGGKRLDNLEHGAKFRLRASLQVLAESPGLAVGFTLMNADGVAVSDLGAIVTGADGSDRLAPGERIEVSAEVENLLNPGRYFVHCGVNRANAAGVALYVHNAIDFVAFGSGHYGGVVTLPHQIEAVGKSRGQMTDAEPAPAPRPVGPLREVSGPSALGGGVRRFFDLLWLLALTEFKRTYFGTALGYVWSLMRPLLFFGVLLFVFTQAFKIGSESPNYPVLLLFGIVLFTLFQEATQSAVGSVAAQEAVVRKTQFPRLVIPLSAVLTSCFNFLPNLLVVFAFMLAWGIDPTWTWLLFPLPVAALLLFTCAVSVALSVLFVRFRDVAIIWVVAAQVLFYATPVLYPIEVLENPSLERLLMINPLAVILQQARVWILAEPEARTAVEVAGGKWHLLPAAAIFVAVCVFAAWIFRREAPRIAEDL